ncbi:MAG TPA: ABC transporter ATP-binding protein, partial [Clostridia bacterium]
MVLFESRNVFKSFKKGIIRPRITDVLEDISFEIEEGESLSIVGPNGSGKSTLINLLTGLLRPSSGTVSYRGKEVSGTVHMKDIAVCMSNGTGLVPEMKAKQFLEYKAKLYGREYEEEHEFHNILQAEHLLDKRIVQLSAGEMQRINILGAFMAKPSVFIFDEPTNNLDIHTRFIFLDILDALKEKKRTVILVSHHTDEIMRTDRMLMLCHGKVIKDEPTAD